MFNKFLVWFDKIPLKVVLSVFFVFSLLIFVFGFSKNHKAYESYVSQRDALLIKQSKYNKVLTKNDVSTYYVDSSGKSSSKTTKTTSQIASNFSLMTEYNNSSQYRAHRNALKKIVKDPSFFSKFYKSDVDSSGTSSITALNTASETRSISVYKVGTNEYHVLIEYVSYNNAKNATTSTVNALSSSYLYFDVVGTANNFTEVTAINGVQLNNTQY